MHYIPTIMKQLRINTYLITDFATWIKRIIENIHLKWIHKYRIRYWNIVLHWIFLMNHLITTCLMKPCVDFQGIKLLNWVCSSQIYGVWLYDNIVKKTLEAPGRHFNDVYLWFCSFTFTNLKRAGYSSNILQVYQEHPAGLRMSERCQSPGVWLNR